MSRIVLLSVSVEQFVLFFEAAESVGSDLRLEAFLLRSVVLVIGLEAGDLGLQFNDVGEQGGLDL